MLFHLCKSEISKDCGASEFHRLDCCRWTEGRWRWRVVGFSSGLWVVVRDECVFGDLRRSWVGVMWSFLVIVGTGFAKVRGSHWWIRVGKRFFCGRISCWRICATKNMELLVLSEAAFTRVFRLKLLWLGLMIFFSLVKYVLLINSYSRNNWVIGFIRITVKRCWYYFWKQFLKTDWCDINRQVIFGDSV